MRKIQQFSFCRYHDPVQKEELIEFYRSSDIFVLTSHKETFGLVYPEAMSQGLPVIYTRGQGFDGHFDEGKVGYAVSDNDPDELAEVILSITNNYSKLSNNAFELVDKFNWNTIADQLIDIYRYNCLQDGD